MKRILVLFSLILVCSGIGLLQASSFSFGSQAGKTAVYWDATGVNPVSEHATVAITPHDLWAPDFAPEAVWISYKNTGIGGTWEPNRGQIRVFSVYENFTASAGSLLKLSVWADDTAGVYLDGAQLKAPVFGQNVCADQAIGCEAGEGGHFSLNLSGGSHELRFDVYQVGTTTDANSNPMGLLYQGTVPDGGMTLMLLGGALVGLETLRRRSRV